LDPHVNPYPLAQHWFAHGRELDDFLVVSIEQSLGLGIVHNGELFRGANGLGPDLGDFLVRRPGDENMPARLGAIVVQAMTPNGDERRESRPNGPDDDALANAGAALGFAIASLITLFAPPKVILAGAMLSAGERLLVPLRAAVERYTPPSLIDVTEIVVHEWGDDIWARGAAAMTLRDLYGAPWSSTGPARRSQ
jgi:predicted NBD/HSP70 family sugar kinase